MSDAQDMTLLLWLPADPVMPVGWWRIARGRLIAEGDDAATLAEMPDHVLAVAPAALVALQWVACGNMTPQQAAVAAPLIAMDASLGDGASLHAVAAEPSQQGEEASVAVAVVSIAIMEGWIARLAALDCPDCAIIPAPMLLPEPQDGFVIGTVGRDQIARGRDSAFEASDGVAAAIIGEAAVARVSEDVLVHRAIAEADAPTINLRQGRFGLRRPSGFDMRWAMRFAACIAAAPMLLAGAGAVELMKIKRATAALDREVVAEVSALLPAVTDAAGAQLALRNEMNRRGVGLGFTAVMSAIMDALRSREDVRLTTANQTPDGTVRVGLAGPDTDAINAVLLSLQQAGWRIAANNAGTADGTATADISVVPQ